MLYVTFNDAATGRDYALVEIRADMHAPLLAQIAGKDRVHTFGAGSVDELLEYRIGGKGYAKTAYAVIDSTQTVESVIFGYKTGTTITSGADMPGNVDTILRARATTPLSRSDNDGGDNATGGDSGGIAFYSISAFVSGGGPRLINTLLANCPAGVQPGTLSPLRTLRKAFPHLADAALGHEEKTVAAFLHLMSCKDPVQAFHMGNGAVVGQINTDANTPHSEDGREGYGVMANYMYTVDADVRGRNRALFHAVAREAAPREALIDLMDTQLAQRAVGLMAKRVMDTLYEPSLVDKLQARLAGLAAARPVFA